MRIHQSSTDEDVPTRRKFLTQSIATVAIAAFGPAKAARAALPDFSKMTQGGTKKPRVGGLASKIRNVGRVMVS